MNARRRLSVAAAVLAVGLVPATATHAGAATLSKSHAKKLAAAAVLTQKDLAGWTATADTGDGELAGEDPTDKQVTKCLGAAEPKTITDNAGRDFANGLQEIDSSSSVVSSAKTAAAYLNKTTSAKGLACFKKYFVVEGQNNGFAVSHLSVKAVKVKVKGADHAAGIQLRATITTIQGSFQMELNDVDALVGRTELDLTAFGFNHKAPSFAKRVHAAA